MNMKPAEYADEAVVKFYPQEWVNEYAHTLEDETVEFTVPIEDATDENGDLFPDDTYLSDRLKGNEKAPEWVRNWEGPFYVVISHLK